MSGNKTNKEFYRNVPLDVFKGMTNQGGFAQYKDLRLIADFIPKDAKVLELGAGYGRCIDFLLEQKHQGEIIGVEQSKTFLDVLKDKYKNNTHVHIIDDDISTMEIDFKADVVLWIFSGLLDFGKEEQVLLLSRIRSWMNKGAKLFVDIPQLTKLSIARYTAEQHVLMETPYGHIETYLPSKEDVEKYAIDAGYAEVRSIDYDTDTDKKRTMFIFSTPSS